jgi:hypothetical protein
VQQVPVGGVDLDNIEAGPDGTADGVTPGRLDGRDISERHGRRVSEVSAVRDSAGPHHGTGPATLRGRSHCSCRLPRGDGGGLAGGVGELDADLLPLAVGELDEAREPVRAIEVRIVPDPGVMRRDAAFGDNGRGLDESKTRPTGNDAPQVCKVPRREVAILAGVLAEGGEGDAVGEGKAADVERGEKLRGGWG